MTDILSKTLHLGKLCADTDYENIVKFITQTESSDLELILKTRLDSFNGGTVLHVLFNWDYNDKISKIPVVCELFELLATNCKVFYVNSSGYLPWELNPYTKVRNMSDEDYDKVLIGMYHLRNKLDLYRYEIPRDDI